MRTPRARRGSRPGRAGERSLNARSYLTDTGVEIPSITAAQMREVDRIATEELGPHLMQMMENAGRNLALAAIRHLGEGWRSTPIVVLAGSGGNGGGGICAARHLANHGADVTAVVTDEDHLGEAGAWQWQLYRASAGHALSRREVHGLVPGLVLDAVLGYSLDGAPRGPAAELISWALGTGAPILALDVPSGVDATTGTAPGEHVRAAATVTLALPKRGLHGAAVGDVWLADIGIPRGVYERAGLDVPSGLFDGRYLVPLRPH